MATTGQPSISDMLTEAFTIGIQRGLEKVKAEQEMIPPLIMLWGSPDYLPAGGAFDYIGAFLSVEDAKAYFEGRYRENEYHWGLVSSLDRLSGAMRLIEVWNAPIHGECWTPAPQSLPWGAIDRSSKNE